MKFEVDRRGKSAPRSKRKLEIENFLDLHSDIFGDLKDLDIDAALVDPLVHDPAVLEITSAHPTYINGPADAEFRLLLGCDRGSMT